MQKKPPFIGRKDELKLLENLVRKKSSSLAVVYGRRRVGKSRLLEEFAKNYKFARLSGLPPTQKTTAQDQRNEFSRQLSRLFGFPNMQMNDWGDLFFMLARETKEGRVVIVLDEISWMGSEDPLFLGKLKNIWDMEMKSNPELILILCGSVSTWIEENILHDTGFMGRVSLTIFLEQLGLSDCNLLLNNIGFRGSDYDKFTIFSVTGGIPRYLEEIHAHLPAEANIQELCFCPSGILFHEFNDIFNDLLTKRGETYKKIVASLVSGVKEIQEISNDVQLAASGYLSECLHDLISLGFIRRDYSWNIKEGKESALSHFRLSDNYLRFYLKYIAPHYSKIENNHYVRIPLSAMPGLDGMMGLQFENMVVSSRKAVWSHLPINIADIVNDNPFFQRKTTRSKGCQIDYMIQTRFKNLFICEIKFSRNKIGAEVIEEVKEKIERISLPRGFSCWPVLIHVNGVTDAVIESRYFTQIIDFSSLLHN